MIRDRLAELQIKGKVMDRFEEVELGPASSPSPNMFMERVAHIRTLLNDLQEDIFQLKRKQDHVLSLPVVSVEHKAQLQEQIARIRLQTRELQPQVHSLEEELRQFEKTARSSTEIRMRRNQCDMVRKKMHDVIRLFNDQQIEYRDRVSKRVKRSLQMAGEHLPESDVDEMLNSQQQLNILHYGIHDAAIFFREVNPLTIAGRVALEDAKQRHNEILELEESLRTLQEMFEDMYMLGEMVDRIDKNIDDAKVQVHDAALNTKVAVEYKKSALRKKWLCIASLILIIIILIAVAIILAVVLTGKSNNNG